MTSGPALLNTTPSSITPTVVPSRTTSKTGLGGDEGELSLIVGEVEALGVDANQLIRRKTTATITADTGSAQGDGPLTANINEISVCANAGDAVTLPTAVAGMEIVVINNGANASDVFPATGADLGAGANTAASLAAGAAIRYTAFDTLTWVAV